MTPYVTRDADQPGDSETILKLSESAFGARADAVGRAELAAVQEMATFRLAHEPHKPEAVAGCAVTIPVDVTFPSPGGLGVQGVDFVSWVCVRQDRRRRGVGATMMRDLADRSRAGDRAWSALTASDPAIYGRFGYGCASTSWTVTLSGGELADAAKAAGDGYEFDFCDTIDEGLEPFHAAWDAFAENYPGVLRWNSRGITRAYTATTDDKSSSPDPAIALLHRGGTPMAGALVYRTPSWGDDNKPNGRMRVVPLVSADDDARIVLAHHLSNVDLFTSIAFSQLSADDALIWAAGGPRNARAVGSDGMWLRPNDVVRALRSLGYARPVDVVVEVTDPLADTVTVRLTVDEGGAVSCEPSGDRPDVTCGVDLLGAACLGGLNPATAAARFRPTEHTPGALRSLLVAMRGEQAPYPTVVL